MEEVLGQGYRFKEVKLMELINVMTRLEQEYTELSLNVTIENCIGHRIDLSSVQSCGVTKPGRALCVYLMLGTGSTLCQCTLCRSQCLKEFIVAFKYGLGMHFFYKNILYMNVKPQVWGYFRNM